MRMNPRGAYILVLALQLVEFFGKDWEVWPWRSGPLGEEYCGFKVHDIQLALSLCLVVRFQVLHSQELLQ